jgi:hypothetical protein
MQNKIGKNVLCTTESWFLAPDGREYKAVFGKLKGIHSSEKTLGFSPNRTHTNWFLEIGNMSIAGCQIMYVVETEEAHLGELLDFDQTKTIAGNLTDQNGFDQALKFWRPTKIYDAGQ